MMSASVLVVAMRWPKCEIINIRDTYTHIFGCSSCLHLCYEYLRQIIEDILTNSYLDAHNVQISFDVVMIG
jgi:hypothetical protein